VAQRAGVDRKTARRYVQAAQDAGLLRDGGVAQLSDELIGQVVQQVRPARSEVPPVFRRPDYLVSAVMAAFRLR
jgi:hypothetical protein